MSGLKVELELDDGSFSTGMIHAGQSVTQFQNKVGGAITSISKMEDHSRSFLSTLRDVTVVLGLTHQALGMVESATTSWVHEIIGVNAEFERMVTIMKTLSTAQDPLKEATESVTKLREMAKDAPFSLNAIHQAFVRLNAAGLKPMEGGMKSLLDAVAAFGGGDNELGRAALAMQEMAGKGVVQMKELRNQLMMAIPSAARLMARSVGESYGEMMSDIHTGTVDAKSTIEALNLEFERSFGGAAQRQMQTFNGQLGRMKVLIQDIAIQNVGKPIGTDGLPNANGFFEIVKKQAVDFNDFLQSGTAKGLGNMLGDSLITIITGLREAIDFVSQFKDEIVAAGEALAIGFGVKASIGAFSGLVGILKGVSGELTFIKTQWATAFENVAANSPVAAFERRLALHKESLALETAADVARNRAKSSQVIADDMQRLAGTQPVAGARTKIEQAKLNMAAMNAEAALQREIIAKHIIDMESEEAARERITASRVIADAAREKAESNPAVTGGIARTMLAQSKLDMAASDAEKKANREQIAATTIALNAQASAQDRVTAAEVLAAEARRVANATPAAAVRTEVEQAAINIAAMKATATAKRDLTAATVATAAVEAAAINGSALAAEESASVLGRSGKNIMAFLPLLATGFGVVATAAPIMALAVGFAAEYFDIFGQKVKEAWQNLEHYGAASSKAAESGDEYVNRKRVALQGLKDQLAETQAGGFNPAAFADGGDAIDPRKAQNLQIAIAAADAELQKLIEDQRRFHAEGETADGKNAAKPTISRIEEALQNSQRNYNRTSLFMDEAYSKRAEELAKAGKSNAVEKAHYDEELQKKNIAYYQEQMGLIKAIAAQNEKAAAVGSPLDKLADITVQADARTRLLDIQRQMNAEMERQVGIHKNAKPVDDTKVIGKAQTELEKLQESIGGYSAGIRGADYEAEKLYETWQRMERSQDSEYVRNLILQIKEAKTQADDLNKIMQGDNKLNKTLDDGITKFKDQIAKDKYGKLSEYEQIVQQIKDGKFAGHGGETPEQQRLTALRQTIISNGEAAKEFGFTLEHALGGTLVDKVITLNDALKGTGEALRGAGGANPLLGLGGAQGAFNVQGGMATLNGSIMAGSGNGGAAAAVDMVNGMIGMRAKDPGQDSQLSQFMSGVDPAITAWCAALVNAALARNGIKGSGSNAASSFAQWGKSVEAASAQKGDVMELADGSHVGFFNGGVRTGANGQVQYNMTSGNSGEKNDANNAPGRSQYGGVEANGWYNAEQINFRRANEQPAMSSNMNLSQENAAKLEALRQEEIKARISAADKLQTDLGAEMKKVFERRDFQSEGIGTNRAKVLQFIQDHGLETSAHSTDEKNPAYVKILAMADKADVASKAYTDRQKSMSSATSASEEIDNKGKEIKDKLAALALTLGKGGKGISESLVTLRTELDKKVEKQVTAYGSRSTQVKEARDQENSIMSDAQSVDSLQKLEAVRKKVEAEKQAVMTENQRDAEQIRLRREGYQQDLANFHGTAEQKAEFQAKINEDLAAQQAALMAKSPIGKQMQEWGDMSKNIQSDVAGMMNSSIDAVSTQIMTGRANWLGLANSIEKTLLSTAMKGAISGLMGGTGLTNMFTGVTGGVGGALGGGGLSKMGGGGGKVGAPMQLGQNAAPGGGFMGMIGSMFGIHHAGDIVGAGNVPTRYAAWSSFNGAPRFHTGGVIGRDEVPIIAQKGEGVFTKAQMAAMSHGGTNGGHAISINNNVTLNASGGTPEANADLAKQVGDHVERVARETVISELMNQMRPGNMMSK